MPYGNDRLAVLIKGAKHLPINANTGQNTCVKGVSVNTPHCGPACLFVCVFQCLQACEVCYVCSGVCCEWIKDCKCLIGMRVCLCSCLCIVFRCLTRQACRQLIQQKTPISEGETG